MKRILAGLLLAGVVACASSKEVKSVDTKMTQKGTSNQGNIGVNDKKEAIIQESRDAGAELTLQQNVNENLQATLDYERNQLQTCRQDMADPRLGGSGEIAAIPEVDNLKNENEIREELGLDEKGNLVVVKKQNLEERMAVEKKYEKSLRDTTKVVKKNRQECEFRLSIAKKKAGL